MAQTVGRIPWGDSDIEDILAGIREPEEIRETDRKGLSSVGYAALKAADRTRRIEGKLEELIAPPAEMEDRIALLQKAMSALCESQIRIKTKLDALLAVLISGASSTHGSSTASGAPTRRAPRSAA